MRKLLVPRLVLLTLLAPVAAVPARAAEGDSPAPVHFSASIGGFMGASYTVELRDGVLTYTSSERGHRNEKQTKLTPTSEEWRAFRKTLDDLEVWQWRADYPNNGTADGTQWSLQIAYLDRTLNTRGDNNYPDARGQPNGKPEPTKVFQRYLAAIRKLIGGGNFE